MKFILLLPHKVLILNMFVLSQNGRHYHYFSFGCSELGILCMIKKYRRLDVSEFTLVQVNHIEGCCMLFGAPPWSSGSVLDPRSLPPVFESRRGHI